MDQLLTVVLLEKDQVEQEIMEQLTQVVVAEVEDIQIQVVVVALVW